MLEYETYKSFADWFSRAFSSFGEIQDHSMIFSELAVKLTDLGVEDWEGEFFTKERQRFFIVIRDIPSTYVDRYNQECLQHIGTNPATILRSMPKVQWDRVVNRYAYRGQINASSWKFVLIESVQDVTLEVYAENLKFVDGSEIENLLRTVLHREISEIYYNQLIISYVYDKRIPKNCFPIYNLYSKIDEILKNK